MRTCVEGDHWTLTGDWSLPPAKVRMEALHSTDREAQLLLGLRHTQHNCGETVFFSFYTTSKVFHPFSIHIIIVNVRQ